MDHSAKISSLIRKFETFRTLADKQIQKCKEFNEIIKEMKEEKLRDKREESNLRNQLLQIQERIIQQQEIKNNLEEAREKHEILEEKYEELLEKYTGLSEELGEKKKMLDVYVKTASKELELMIDNTRLNKTLEKREADYDLLVMELQTMKKENQIRFQEIVSEKNKQVQSLKDEYQAEIAKLKVELREKIFENEEIINHSNRALSLYRKQVTDYEQTIARYENERLIILGDAEQPAGVSTTEQINFSTVKKVQKSVNEERKLKISWGENTVSQLTEVNEKPVLSVKPISTKDVHSILKKVDTKNDNNWRAPTIRFPKSSQISSDNAKPELKKRKLFSPSEDDFLNE